MIYETNWYIELRQKSETFLIIVVLTEVDNDLLRAGVEHVEKLAVLGVQAAGREIVDTPQSVNQFPLNLNQIELCDEYNCKIC